MQIEFKTNENKEYKIDGIRDNMVNAKESAKQLLELSYQIFKKAILKKKILKSLYW